MAFRKGVDEAAKASKGNFARTEFFKLEDKGSALVRFITDADEWITVDQHQMIPTKDKPSDYEGNWPEKMGSVCRKDEAFDYGECYICDFLVDGKKIKRPSGRTWALACIREEVREDGKIAGYRDKTREVVKKIGDKEETVTEKDIVVVNMAWKNFFSIMKGFAEYYGTVLDRDYHIKRTGDDQSTTYQIVPLDPLIMDDKGTKFDLRDPQFASRYETDLDLEKVIAERADDEFYARFFDPRVTATKEGKVEKTGASPEAPKPDNDMDQEKLAAMAERVKNFGQAEGAPSNGGSEAPAQPAPAGAGAGGVKNFD
jgi:hypothetical protein